MDTEKQKAVVIQTDASGNITKSMRGSDFIVDMNEWKEVTNDDLVIFALDPISQRQVRFEPHTQKLSKKPRVKIELNKQILTTSVDKVTARLVKVDGDIRPDRLFDIQVNSQVKQVRLGETFYISSTVANRLTVNVTDKDVYVKERPHTIIVTTDPSFYVQKQLRTKPSSATVLPGGAKRKQEFDL